MRIKKTFETTAWIVATDDPEEVFRFDQLRNWETRDGNKWVPVTNRKKKKELEALYLEYLKKNYTYLNTFESDFTPSLIMKGGLPCVRVSNPSHWSETFEREAGNRGDYDRNQADIKKMLRAKRSHNK